PRGGPVTPAIAIVADDSTGSGDTAVQFVRAGWTTRSSIDGAHEASAAPAADDVDVSAVTTHSRASPASEAGAVIRRNVQRSRAAGVARSSLWTDPKASPPVGDTQAAWASYSRTWRPGKPKPDSWGGLYQQAVTAIRTRTDRSMAHVATVD
ncbi:hypothetical protein OY671_009942, partial [Metschnikowia pulcherrima]